MLSRGDDDTYCESGDTSVVKLAFCILEECLFFFVLFFSLHDGTWFSPSSDDDGAGFLR